MSELERVAVIGLGSMGFGMASSLARAGFAVSGYDVGAAALARLGPLGARAAASPADAARDAAVVVSVVVNAAQTEAVLFGPEGVADAMPEGAVFVSSATMDPDVVRGLAHRLESKGRHYLDAPMSGGAERAGKGELTFLASGSPAARPPSRPGGRRSARWRARSTSSAPSPARARPSR